MIAIKGVCRCSMLFYLGRRVLGGHVCYMSCGERLNVRMVISVCLANGGCPMKPALRTWWRGYSSICFIIVVVTLSFQALLARLLVCYSSARLLVYSFAARLLVCSSTRVLVCSSARLLPPPSPPPPGELRGMLRNFVEAEQSQSQLRTRLPLIYSSSPTNMQAAQLKQNIIHYFQLDTIDSIRYS